jgi:hypothetical protein
MLITIEDVKKRFMNTLMHGRIVDPIFSLPTVAEDAVQRISYREYFMASPYPSAQRIGL